MAEGGAGRVSQLSTKSGQGQNRITTDGVHRTLPMLAASNRLAAGRYDAAGNLTSWAGETYGFDVLDRMQTRNFPERTHIFTVDGERLFTFDWDPGTGAITERWTLRNLDGSVLTRYETDGGNAGTWRWMQDYVYRDGTMLASRVRFDDGAIGVRDTVVDHLGTPRLIGDRFDGLRTQHFFGFGEPIDLAASRSDPERKRFTGHERDLGTLGGAGGVQVELDYMRARFHSPWTARFLSVDPARESANPQRPQTWNRYSYAFNNPVTLVDPDGQIALKPKLNARSSRQVERNRRIRTRVKSSLEATPALAAIADGFLAGFAPASSDELNESALGMMNPIAAAGRAPGALLARVAKLLIGKNPRKVKFKSGGRVPGSVQVNTDLPGGIEGGHSKFTELTGLTPDVVPGTTATHRLKDGTTVELRIKEDGTAKLTITSVVNRLQEKITFTTSKE